MNGGSANAQGYTVADLGAIAGANAKPYGINDAGHVVGGAGGHGFL